MAGDAIRRYSLDEINNLRASGKATKTADDAPEIELDEDFWRAAQIVDTGSRKTSIHLRIDPETLAFFRSAGRGHLTRMAKVLKAYAQSRGGAKG
jgi:uncharacterized protein (DUF4415 family)